MPAIADEVVPTLLLAATRLTGHKRRRFQAEVALQYCGGSARRAESAFGWGPAAPSPPSAGGATPSAPARTNSGPASGASRTSSPSAARRPRRCPPNSKGPPALNWSEPDWNAKQYPLYR